jgi:hypothetical protein
MLLSMSRTQTRFVLLPPARNPISTVFRNVGSDSLRYESMLAEMQRFRGRIYAEDGAIQLHELTPDGRHKMAVDDQSWHVLSVDPSGQICACIRYLEESRAGGFDDLFVRHAAITRSAHANRFRHAVESELTRARQSGIAFGECGGWAVAERYRGTIEPLRTALAVFGLMELLGGSLGVATATFRHGSATILQRIGLAPVSQDGADLPPYYDPQYECEMQLLRFDSRFPNPKYSEAVRELSATLAVAPVIRRNNPGTALRGGALRMPVPHVGYPTLATAS